MPDSSLYPVGRVPTATVALLAVALVFVPLLIAVSQPLTYFSVLAVLGSSAVWSTLLWFHWKRSITVLVPSITIPSLRAARRTSKMATLRTVGLLCGFLGTSLLSAGDLTTYRGFQFGMNLPAAAKQAGMKESEARLVHQRPALIQELQWQPSSLRGSRDADPIKTGFLSFYKNELFRIVVAYDRYRVEGMTSDDIIKAISTTYGTATRPKGEIAYHTDYPEVSPIVARWEDPQHSYNLVRSSDGGSFLMVMYAKRLDTLASTAILEASRLDATEAPQREVEAQKKQREDERLVLEKARAANAPNFQP